MRWENESSERDYLLDIIISQDIIYEAYREGFINWNVYMKALERVQTTCNDIWMFNQEGYENRMAYNYYF